ncbi:MAG: type II secretion system protein [Pseudomonadota bacterium]
MNEKQTNRHRAYSQSGFTLVEMIVVLVLIGICSALAGMFITTAAKGAVLARANAELSQKVQNTFSRLTLEFENIAAVSSTTTSSINFQLRYPQVFNSDQSRHIAWLSSTKELKINYSDTAPDQNTGSILMDRVCAFSLTYKTGLELNGSNGTWTTANPLSGLYLICVSMTVEHPDPAQDPITFSTQICPRRSSRSNGPEQWNK